MHSGTANSSETDSARPGSMVVAPFKHPILVTRPFLPPLNEYTDGLKEIWDSQWLTNNGRVLRRFTKSLSRELDTDRLALFNNGTIALQLGLHSLAVTGEAVTSPFTFVATTHALSWNNVRPVFADIEPQFYTLDPRKVEAAITPSTTAIVAVHVYGHPCNLDALADIAKRHNLSLIYDAAHAFGVKVNGVSIAHYGDLNMFSFHATKLFHSIEGGMLTFSDPLLKSHLNYLKNFGFKNDVEVVLRGTNGKMNEMQALMGEMVLRYLPQILSKRRTLYERYRARLGDVPGVKLVPTLPAEVSYNYSYMPVEIHEREFGLSRDGLYEALKLYNIFARRYFYPLTCDFACYRGLPGTDPLTVARGVAARILTLPIYYDLSLRDVDKICDIIVQIRNTNT